MGKPLDGCDLTSLLKSPTDATLVKHTDGKVRDSMVWHFPNSAAMESTIRIGDFKLVRNYSHINDARVPELELFQLYDSTGDTQKRVDIEEAKNLAESMPEKAKEMNEKLTAALTEMKASYPYLNPHYHKPLPHKEKVCKVTGHKIDGAKVTFNYQENGAKVVQADLLYTLNGGEIYEEWFRVSATIVDGKQAVATLPKGTTHYLINLVDENQFLRSHPELPSTGDLSKKKEKYSVHAIHVKGSKPMLNPVEPGR